jgi:hypothetical protein
MITCPVCQQHEPEGEVFCSECGARLVTLWAEITSTEAFIDTAMVRETARLRTSAPLQLAPGQVSLSFVGQGGDPVILSGRAEYLLGRDGHEDTVPDVNLNLFGGQDKGVSRAHAALRAERGQLLLVDLGSTNGTRLNGVRLTAQQPVRVSNGDEIRLGRLTLKVHFTL